MCTYKVLTHTNNGYIIRCNECYHYQIGFGTTVFCLSEEQYAAFGKAMHKQLKFHQFKGFPYQKMIQLNTFSENSCMTLTLDELRNLVNMVEEAGLLLTVEQLLSPENHNN